MKALKYLACYITPALVLFSIWSANFYSYTALLILFAFFPILELFLKPNASNMSKVEEELVLQDKTYDIILWLLVPMQYFILIYFLFQMTLELSPSVRTGMIISMGMACGVIGINAAHELGHRNTKFEQTLSKMLLLTSLYMHFFIEHNRGHHKNVSTDEDPASSKYGETLYAFWFRSILHSYISAWVLEKEKLEMRKKSFWSIHNEMLMFQLIQLALLIAIYLFFGFYILLYFLAAALIGIILLETVNYIEHYGLRRKMKNGKYERTMPIHSWNSNHPLGRLVLLELSRHSDHHYIASRKYQILRHHDASPQMPTGYPGMMLLSLFPPLWFKLMHNKIKAYKETAEGEDLD
jgi:alkane 1-monooxygenase